MAGRGQPQRPNGASQGKICQFKLVLLGKSPVGKSSLVLRFVKGQFHEFQESTIGAAFLTQTVCVDDTTVKFEIWDTAGQERYHPLASMYYRGAQAAIVVYDITNTDTFSRAKTWVKELQQQASPNIVIALAGNKADLANKRLVEYEDAQSYADDNGLLFMETSAKTAMNVNEIFLAIASSCSESTVDSDHSELNSSSAYEVEAKPDYEDVYTQNREESPIPSSNEEAAVLYADDPIADAEWTARYEEEIEATEELERKLKDRLDRIVELNEWCKCGNCSVESLQNVSECYCCSELEGCLESMKSGLVLQDLPQGEKLTCITEHPGFNPVCLQKWSLRLASWKYKTKGKHRYKQTGTEESFLRSVSYQEFSRLVYGVLRNKRILLPACAYTAIRKEFPVNKDETYTGFDLDEEN